jgi:hypothetical protein
MIAKTKQSIEQSVSIADSAAIEKLRNELKKLETSVTSSQKHSDGKLCDL